MANVIIPNKDKHKYVVGIDFGHGETSAAICELEWDKTAGQRLSEVFDIDIDCKARAKVIPSAICRLNDGGIAIGDDAFEHSTDNNGIRICFKQAPESIYGEAESLMCEYMKAVYNKICENDDRLQAGNHIVYIARPSGWTNEEAKELYRQMAIKAGIPLAGLTSESRAAIFYAKGSKVNFAKDIDKGAIVFDLGSSTLDFTYLSDQDKPIDYGYNLGASIIDKAIYSRLVLKSDDVKDFVSKYPSYRDALLFKARKFKEQAYSRNPESKTIGGFPLEQIISDDEDSLGDYTGVYVNLRIKNLQELNDIIEEETCYQKSLKDALEDFKKNHIKLRPVNGVFLTGGASRMNFIRPLIAEVMELPADKVKIDGDNPSLTISRGIALLGAADATTQLLVSKLQSSIDDFLTENKLINPLVESLSSNISKKAWDVVDTACENWIKYGPGTSRDDLKMEVEKRLTYFQTVKLNDVINETVQAFIKNEQDVIRKQMNAIISQYAPGREISIEGNVRFGNHDAITSSLRNMTAVINAISASMSDIIGEILWKALAAFLWGVFAIPYYILKAIFTSDESKRRDKAKDILNKKDEITSNVRNSIYSNLKKNREFKTQVSKSLKEYFTTVIEANLEKVTIPIE